MISDGVLVLEKNKHPHQLKLNLAQAMIRLDVKCTAGKTIR